MEKQRLNPTVVYVLAIIGLLCCCFGGLGIVLALPAYFMAKSNIKKAVENPDIYDETSINPMNTAKIVALVISIICGLFLIYNIYDLSTGGWAQRELFIEEFMKGYQEGLEQG